MPTFKLDGKEIPFQPGETIIKAAYNVGIEIPHYCWHPGLSVAANCRMCLVEIAAPQGAKPMLLDVLEWDAAVSDYVPKHKPKLQPACQMMAADGMEVHSDTSQHVTQARKAVQEFLLLNHPVDCPICDQAGECRLQDYWLDHGRFKKRMTDEPVHKPKAVVFGPTIVYDAERCVMCTRCIRFMDEIAHDHVLDMRERGNLNEIVVSPGRQLDGNYTFMTEHVCPVGALTTKDFRFKARVWFLRSANSICQGCATGCNAHLDYDPRDNKAYRYRPRDNEAVNRYWMCDDGMLSYHRANEGRIVEATVEGKIDSVVGAIGEARRRLENAPKETIGIVLSAQHSLEDNWALLQLATAHFRTANLYLAGRPDGNEDTILIHKDKNPNTLGVKELAPSVQSFDALIEGIRANKIQHVIALGGAAPDETAVTLDVLKRLRTLVTLSAHDGVLTRAAHVVLPATSWAEMTGTFVNAKGIRQIADKALLPKGHSEPAWAIAGRLGQALGFQPGWTRFKEVQAKMAKETPALPASSLPNVGLSP